ncbi:MAG: hypothetical protein ABH858_02230, partial [Candidatus Omnitrophota bacterium]
MITYLSYRKGRISFKFAVFFVVVSLLATSIVMYTPKEQAVTYASALSYMPPPHERIATTAHEEFILLKGMRLYPADPFRFDFILDEGGEKLDEQEINEQSGRIIKYFLSSLTIPEEDLWVNLSPYEQETVVPAELGATEMGKDLLGEDYILKQLLASLTYPESPLGKQFWKKVYQRAFTLFGTTKIPINTFNKIWIVPEHAVVYEDKDKAFIKTSRLKVMLEEDYLALNNNLNNREFKTNKLKAGEVKDINNFASAVTKEIILPVIEEEVNYGKNFALLRQIYHALILATWFKKKLRHKIDSEIGDGRLEIGDNKEVPILQRVFVDKKKIKGVDVDDPKIKEKIY